MQQNLFKYRKLLQQICEHLHKISDNVVSRAIFANSQGHGRAKLRTTNYFKYIATNYNNTSESTR